MKFNIQKCVIVVPCYNEAKRLDTAAFRIFSSNHPLIDFLFVDDGSTDGTRELLDELNREDGEHFKTLHLERNCGKAEAVRRGMRQASQLGPRYAGYWDADLATPLEAIPDFVKYLDKYPHVQIIFGSRVRLLGRQIDRRPLRHYLGRIFATLASVVLGLAIYDTQCGAKLFRISPAIDWLFEQPFSSKWIFDVEILARFLHDRRGVDLPPAEEVIHEIPLHRWKDIAGSKLKPRDFLKAIIELWTIHRMWLRKDASSPRLALALDESE